MSEPRWLLDSLGAIMVAISTYCSLQLLLSRRPRRRVQMDINVAHVAMGVGMAGMLVPSLTSLPTRLWEDSA